MKNDAQPQGIPLSKEQTSQLQRLSVKFQSLDLTYLELKEQVENLIKTLLAKISTLETEKTELQAELDKHEKPTP